MSWFQRIFINRKVSPFQPTHEISPCSGKRWVITDIHGCYFTLLALLEQLHLSKNDQLFLLGDLVNKGPKSSKVLDEVIRLQKSGFQLFTLRGNHEQMLIDCAEHEAYKLNFMLEKFNSTDLLQRKNKVKSKYLNFFTDLPYYFELERHFLVHAGFNFNKPNPFTDYDSMMGIRKFEANAIIAKGKQIIHGHVPHNLPIIQHNIANKKLVIPLDNGCVYWKSRENQGNLVALELNDGELKLQECEDFKMVFGTRMAVN